MSLAVFNRAFRPQPYFILAGDKKFQNALQNYK